MLPALICVGAYNAKDMYREAIAECRKARELNDSGDGQPRIFWIVGGLAERDEELSTLHKPTCSEEEIESYAWPQGADGKALKEVPVDDSNHALDAMRYTAAYLDGLARESKPLAVLGLGSFKLPELPGLNLRLR